MGAVVVLAFRAVSREQPEVEAVFSIAVSPRWVSLFFLQSGTKLSDPKGLLKGSGTKVRHIVLESAEDFMRRKLASIQVERLVDSWMEDFGESLGQRLFYCGVELIDEL